MALARTWWCIVLALVFAPTAQADPLADAQADIAAYRFHDARARLDSVLQADPTRVEARVALGEVLFEMGAFADSVAELERAVKQAPEHAPAHYWLARAYGALGEQSGLLQQARLAIPVRRAFERAVELDPGYVRARVGLTQFYLRAPGLFGGSRKRAWRQIETLAASAPEEAGLLEALAHERAGEPAHAEAVFARLRDATADAGHMHARVLEENAAFLMRRDRPRAAVELLEIAPLVAPHDPDLWEALGHAHGALGEQSAARDAYQRALAINPWQSGARTPLTGPEPQPAGSTLPAR